MSVMNALSDGLQRAVERWDEKGWPRPLAMVVSGSGLAVELGDPVDRQTDLAEWLPFETHAIEGHPLSTQLLMTRPDLPVFYQKGRLHSYQGYDAHQTVFAVRFGALLGVRTLIMTNAAGGLNPTYSPGNLVLLHDHLNLIGLNPLRGSIPSEWGPQFPDMSRPYDRDLRQLGIKIATQQGFDLAEGVYAAVAGPSYETPAEIRMLQTLGADLVGMSTALEVIAARHMGVRCLGLSVVTNLASGVGTESTDHAEVIAAGKAAASRLQSFLTALLQSEELV